MIQFDSADIDCPSFLTNKTKNWIELVAESFNVKVGELFFVFCSDEFLYEMNVKYLNHSTYTDIITFDLSNSPQYLSGELYISFDRINENSQSMNQSVELETYRVMIHGVLHLLGFKDKLPHEETEMRLQEDKCLSLLA